MCVFICKAVFLILLGFPNKPPFLASTLLHVFHYLRERSLNFLFLPLSCCTVLSANPEEHSASGLSVTCSVVFGIEKERRQLELPFCGEPVASARSFTRAYRKLKD